MRRRWSLLLVALFLWACSGQVSTTTTSAAPALSPDASGVTSTTEAKATESLVWPGIEVLVTNDSGVFLVHSTGQATQLVTGPVTYAVEDTRGGLLLARVTDTDRNKGDTTRVTIYVDQILLTTS
jgi:hypothetical protein